VTSRSVRLKGSGWLKIDALQAAAREVQNIRGMIRKLSFVAEPTSPDVPILIRWLPASSMGASDQVSSHSVRRAKRFCVPK